MFDNYGFTYKVRFSIQTPDDSRQKHSSEFLIYTTYELPLRYTYDNKKEFILNNANVINIVTHSQKHAKGDPVINIMKNELRTFFKWGGRTRSAAPNKWKVALVTPSKDMALMIEKGDTYYNFMGQRTKKTNLLQALSRFIYRACFETDAIKLLEYIMKLISLPENVAYVLENRTPYHFYDLETRKKIECRLNTQLISPSEAALEISDGIWASIDITDLDVMVNYYYHGHGRSKKWKLVSPKKLWTMLMDKEPSDSQLKLMKEFLQQNRTNDIVESRALELMNSLVVKYPKRIKIIETTIDETEYKIMLVRGKMADWIIVNGAKSITETQKVKTFVFVSNILNNFEQSKARTGRRPRRPLRGGVPIENLGGVLRGPICIDNMHTNSSLGDQYASRALALLNDNITIKLVYTIDRYLPKSVLDNGFQSRFTTKWELINKDTEQWEKFI